MNVLCWLLGHTDSKVREHDGMQRWSICRRCVTQYREDDTGGVLMREVGHGLVLPRGYGIAWLHYIRDSGVAMPIPLNVVAGALRRAWCWLKVPRLLVRDPYAAYREGLEEGHRQASGK
jgi:hypothetical protein